MAKCGVKFEVAKVCQDGRATMSVCCKECRHIKTCKSPCGYVQISKECSHKK